MMFQIAEAMPRDAQGILACCNPVPTLVKQYVNEIHLLIVQAKELALTANKNLSVVVASSQMDARDTSKQTGVSGSSLLQPPLIDPDMKSHRLLVNGDSPVSAAMPSSFGRVLASGPPVTRAEPAISLFQICEEKDLTDGERKAERIKASFVNPFQKFLPVKSQSETTEGKSVIDEQQTQEQVHMINEQWRRAAQTSQTSGDNAGKKRELSDDEQAPEDLTPLRNKVPGKSSKKRKRDSGEASPSTCHTNDTDSTTFVPFNYSTADYSTFSGGRETEATDKPIVFNPYRDSKQSKGPRSKVHMKSGHRNLTFSSNKRADQKHNWPRR